MRSRVWPAALLLLLAFPCVPAEAGVIRGTVRVHGRSARGTPAPRAHAGHSDASANATPSRRGAVTDAVIYVESIPDSSEEALARGVPRPRLAQQHQCFVPRVLPVACGSAVEFSNLDPVYHSVFSPSPLRRFDLGKYSRGKSRTVTFTRCGVVNVYCDIHSDMEAFIVVVPHHAFTQPGDGGVFQLPPLPPGRYRLRAWHPDFHELRSSVVVPERGDVSVDLRF